MPTLSDMGIPGAGAGILMPKLRKNFRISFNGIGQLVPANNSRNLMMQVITTSLPSLTFEQVQLNRYNSTAYVAGKHEWEAINFTFEDDIGGLATQVITAQIDTQQRLVGSDLDARWLNTAATGSDYKFSARIDQLDGDEGVVDSWLLSGCWFVSVDFGDRDYSASEAATVAVSMRFDVASHINTGAGYGTALGGGA